MQLSLCVFSFSNLTKILLNWPEAQTYQCIFITLCPEAQTYYGIFSSLCPEAQTYQCIFITVCPEAQTYQCIFITVCPEAQTYQCIFITVCPEAQTYQCIFISVCPEAQTYQCIFISVCPEAQTYQCIFITVCRFAIIRSPTERFSCYIRIWDDIYYKMYYVRAGVSWQLCQFPIWVFGGNFVKSGYNSLIRLVSPCMTSCNVMTCCDS